MSDQVLGELEIRAEIKSKKDSEEKKVTEVRVFSSKQGNLPEYMTGELEKVVVALCLLLTFQMGEGIFRMKHLESLLQWKKRLFVLDTEYLSYYLPAEEKVARVAGFNGRPDHFRMLYFQST